MANTFLFLIVNCIILIITLAVLYWIIKKAVKNGILEAQREMAHPEPKVKYPVQIDEDHPDIPFPEKEP